MGRETDFLLSSKYNPVKIGSAEAGFKTIETNNDSISDISGHVSREVEVEQVELQEDLEDN